MEADFVIVGADSALRDGLPAVRAGQLRHRHDYGGRDAGPFIQMPGALSYPMNMSLYDLGCRWSSPAR